MKEKSLNAILIAGINALNLNVSPQQLAQLETYIQLLLKWNQAYNLTAITELEKVISHHILDSLSIVPYLQGDTWIDVGTGAGLPGIPLAIICPDKKISLLDSNQKKTTFLTYVVNHLVLEHVSVISSRVENYSPEQAFDVIMTRAFSSLTQMLQCTQHLASKDSLFLALKGKFPEEELNQLPEFVQVRDIKNLQVPGVDASRHLVVLTIEK